MATNKTATKGGTMAISVVESLDIVEKLYKIGRAPDAQFYLFLSPPGCGKTSWMLAHMKAESFLINGKIYGENTAAIPLVQSPVPSVEKYIAARKEVKELLDEEDRKDEVLVEKLVDLKLKKESERDIHMRPPRYFELENFLLKYDAEVYDPAKKNIPIIWVDEATQMTVEARDQLITALVDGVLMRELGIKWKPMVIMLANGRSFGGANNFPLSPRQVARCIQMIFVPEGTEDIPVPTNGMNSIGSKELRKRYHSWVVESFTSGKNSLSKSELPSNHPGNPRAQNTLLWFVERVRKLKIPNPLEFMTTIVNGYIDSTVIPDALEMVRQYFTNLPASLEEVRAILEGKSPKPKNLTKVTDQEWVQWAKYRTDGTPQANDDLAQFLILIGVSKEIAEAVKMQTV